MKLYHGTNEQFDDFRLPHEPVNYEYYGPALFFSSNYDVAKYYGHQVIEVDIPDSVIDVRVDAKGEVIRCVDGVPEMIKTGGIIAIENVLDANLYGRQFQHFDLPDTEVGEYKYFHYYILNNKWKTKQEMDDETNKLDSAGIAYKKSYDKILRKYHIYTLNYLTKEQAIAAFNAGADVKKGMCKTPETATTVIFAGQKALDILNFVKNAKKQG